MLTHVTLLKFLEDQSSHDTKVIKCDDVLPLDPSEGILITLREYLMRSTELSYRDKCFWQRWDELILHIIEINLLTNI